MSGAKRPAIYGPEPWERDGDRTWSHWDLWLCLVALLDHDGDLVALAEAIEGEARFCGHSDTEAKLSHLDDLAQRLAAAGLDAEALAARADTTTRARALASCPAVLYGHLGRTLREGAR